MGLFSFVETFFFVSLGITFILILLLVYHFRQRFVALEQKCDTMFELINNIVTELNNERRSVQGIGSSEPHILFYPETDSKPLAAQPSVRTEEFVNMDESDSDSEEDDSDSEEDDSDSDSEEDDSDSDEENHAYIQMTQLDAGSVKVITLDNVEELTELPYDDLDISDSEDDMNDLPVTLVASDPIVVEKLEVTHLDNILEETPLEKPPTDVYNKMSIQALKALVITTGLSSDPSKMKKADLVKLLETAGQ